METHLPHLLSGLFLTTIDKYFSLVVSSDLQGISYI